MSSTVEIGGLADAVMQSLREYDDLSKDAIKKAVRKSARQVKSDIQSNAPERTGAYAKSWGVKKERENSQLLSLIVHSRNRYQLAHLLEFGHAKRGGGRTRAFPHIAPAEEHGKEMLVEEIERSL